MPHSCGFLKLVNPLGGRPYWLVLSPCGVWVHKNGAPRRFYSHRAADTLRRALWGQRFNPAFLETSETS